MYTVVPTVTATDPARGWGRAPVAVAVAGAAVPPGDAGDVEDEDEEDDEEEDDDEAGGEVEEATMDVDAEDAGNDWTVELAVPAIPPKM
jgi:hypothetical protein